MWKYEVSVFTTATPRAVWRLWSDVNHWKRWQPEAEASHIHGPFRSGTHVDLRLKSGAKLDLELAEVDHEHRFVARTRGAATTRTVMTHEIRETAHGVRILLAIRIEGAMARMIGLLIGRRLRDAYDRSVKNLARLAAAASGVFPVPEDELHLLH
jgi:hypothetical protein